MSDEKLSFETWRSCLREDCERREKLLEYNNLGDECLRVLWEAGTMPSVQGVIDGGKKVA